MSEHTESTGSLTPTNSTINIAKPMRIYCVGVIEDDGVLRSVEMYGLCPFFYTEAKARKCREAVGRIGILADIVAINIANAEVVI